MKDWLNRTTNQIIHIDEKSVILGNGNNDLICNYVIIVIKHEIYKAKWNRAKVNITKVKEVLKYVMDTDIYISNVKHPAKHPGKMSISLQRTQKRMNPKTYEDYKYPYKKDCVLKTLIYVYNSCLLK